MVDDKDFAVMINGMILTIIGLSVVMGCLILLVLSLFLLRVVLL